MSIEYIKNTALDIKLVTLRSSMIFPRIEKLFIYTYCHENTNNWQPRLDVMTRLKLD